MSAFWIDLSSNCSHSDLLVLTRYQNDKGGKKNFVFPDGGSLDCFHLYGWYPVLEDIW